MRPVLFMIWVAAIGCASAGGETPDGEPAPTADGDPRADGAPAAACWDAETIDTGAAAPTPVAAWPDLHVTDAGDVEVAYRLDWGARRLARRGAGPWVFDDAADVGALAQTRAIGADGRDHVCYATHDVGVRAWIECAERRSESDPWTTATVDPDIDLFATSLLTLATAPDGTAHLLYTDGNVDDADGVASHAWKPPGATAWSTAPLGPAWGGYRPVAVDADGCVHVAEVAAAGAQWRVDHAVQCAGGAWQRNAIEQLAARPLLARHGLALGPSGAVHVVYHVGAALHVAQRRGDAPSPWSIELIDDDLPIRGGVSGPAAIAATPAGGAVISYVTSDATIDDRILLELAPDGARTRASAGTATLVGGSAVTVDAAGAIHAVFESNDLDGDQTRYRLDHVQRCAVSPSLR
jgi:hypothetical protein